MRRKLLTLAFISACGRVPEPSSTTGTSAPPAAEPSAPVEVPAGKPAARAPEAARRAPPEEDLQTEDREANPTSESVTLTLNISPPVKAIVMWGGKQVGRLTPDRPSLELQRPRASGPLDLEIRAEGFLLHHTRLHSDRNDKVNVRLVREADAPGLFGYRNSSAATAAKAKK